MTPRFLALKSAGDRAHITRSSGSVTSSQRFGIHVFNRSTMEKMLPPNVYASVVKASEGRGKLESSHADAVAAAMKEWALSLGATHYSHMFQPLTGSSAEKHDSFIELTASDGVIEKFGGKQLIQGEPDASSFPSGGLRSTYEARGYTGWDPSSPVFVWKAGDGVTLCIPSVFFSWTGHVLDNKIPLLRSDQKISDASMRLLKLTGTKATRVYSNLGWEQEYFIVDRALRNLRPDLVALGKTVYGAKSAKGQELQDHYFGAVKDRILNFMQDFETEALKLGIPVKTRHNEVAPAQHEVAAVYEKAIVAVDHNILIMELMRQIATKHELACLLHEKPFAGINGSGKHSNWSLSTDTGINLLDPTDTPENQIQFLIILAAILHGVHEYADLLLASICHAGNDDRLGGHEAPPAIISVYLGQALEEILEGIEKEGFSAGSNKKSGYDLGMPHIPDLTKGETDRNRTSPFAFTGNKFEFRAVGSSANCAFPITVINVAVADSLNRIMDEIEPALKGKKLSQKNFLDAAMPVLRKFLKASRNIRFTGDGYSKSWEEEAKKRKLPKAKSAAETFIAMIDPKNVKAFNGVLTGEELASRYEIFCENYSDIRSIEVNVMLDMFRTQFLPVAMDYQKRLAESINTAKEALGKSAKGFKQQETTLSCLVNQIAEAIDEVDQLEKEYDTTMKLTGQKKATAFADKVRPQGKKARTAVDALELMVDDACWPVPKYRELLLMV